ncbi:CRISPR-associated protein, partial [Nocardiopsis sp. MG754419]|nr:CRISPR-associated protein [Nocardiopsis sp. MG754419]
PGPGEGTGPPAPRPARIRLRATPVLTGGAPLTTTRMTVDALFGDAVDGRLFTTDLHCGGTAEAVLDVPEPDGAVCGLLALLVRELVTVPFDTLGAGEGVGHGRLLVTRAALVVHGGPDRSITPDGGDGTVDLTAAFDDPDGREGRLVRGWLRTLHTRLTQEGPT